MDIVVCYLLALALSRAHSVLSQSSEVGIVDENYACVELHGEMVLSPKNAARNVAFLHRLSGCNFDSKNFACKLTVTEVLSRLAGVDVEAKRNLFRSRLRIVGEDEKNSSIVDHNNDEMNLANITIEDENAFLLEAEHLVLGGCDAISSSSSSFPVKCLSPCSTVQPRASFNWGS